MITPLSFVSLPFISEFYFSYYIEMSLNIKPCIIIFIKVIASRPKHLSTECFIKTSILKFAPVIDILIFLQNHGRYRTENSSSGEVEGEATPVEGAGEGKV